MTRPALSSLLTALLLAVLLAPPVRAEPGHCRFKQFAPKLRIWYPACQMPVATASECEALISAYRVQVEYAPGACSARGVTAVCEAAGRKIYFYQGRESDLKRGCEGFLRGTWRSDLVPKG